MKQLYYDRKEIEELKEQLKLQKKMLADKDAEIQQLRYCNNYMFLPSCFSYSKSWLLFEKGFNLVCAAYDSRNPTPITSAWLIKTLHSNLSVAFGKCDKN